MKAVFFVSSLFLSIAGHAEIIVKEVLANSTKAIELMPKEPQLLIFFGENCSFCESQVKELPCLENNEISYTTLMLMKNEQKAHREKVKLKLKNSLFLSNEKLEESLKLNSKITPTLIFLGDKKIKKVFGRKSCQEIIEYGKYKRAH